MELGHDIDFTERVQRVFKVDGVQIKIKDYFPSAFAHIRQRLGIHYDDFIESLCAIVGGKEGEGKSGQLFFFTDDKKFVI